jgi:hypothetical protein
VLLAEAIKIYVLALLFSHVVGLLVNLNRAVAIGNLY